MRVLSEKPGGNLSPGPVGWCGLTAGCEISVEAENPQVEYRLYMWAELDSSLRPKLIAKKN